MLPEAIKSVGGKNNFRDWKLLRSQVREERLKIFADQLLQTWKLIEIVDMAVVRSCNHAIDAVKKKLRLETRIPNFHCSLFCTYESFWTQPHIITTVSEIRSFFFAWCNFDNFLYITLQMNIYILMSERTKLWT